MRVAASDVADGRRCEAGVALKQTAGHVGVRARKPFEQHVPEVSPLAIHDSAAQAHAGAIVRRYPSRLRPAYHGDT